MAQMQGKGTRVTFDVFRDGLSAQIIFAFDGTPTQRPQTTVWLGPVEDFRALYRLIAGELAEAGVPNPQASESIVEHTGDTAT